MGWSSSCLISGDFNGDGRPDVVTGVGSAIEILRNLVGHPWPLAVNDVRPRAAIEMSCSPNPARGIARVRFTLALATDIRLTVRDVSGRRITDVANGRFAAGVHSALWSPGASRARPGVYFMDLQASGRRS